MSAKGFRLEMNRIINATEAQYCDQSLIDYTIDRITHFRIIRGPIQTMNKYVNVMSMVDLGESTKSKPFVRESVENREMKR